MYVKSIDDGGILRAITPSATAFVRNCKAIRANSAGVIILEWENEAQLTVNVLAGEVLPLQGRFKVLPTGTTASAQGIFER